MTDTQAGQAQRDRLPRNRQRERVLQMVREHDGAVDAVELSAEIGLHVTTVRFHLDALCDEGVVARTRLGRPSAGRPRTGYLAVEERLDYQVLAEVLAAELGRSEQTRARRAQRAGRKWAARIEASTLAETAAPSDEVADDPLDRAARRATNVFTRMGFAAELATAGDAADRETPTSGRERTIRLNACPVRELARAHPEVGCAVHLGLLQGLLDEPTAPPGRRRAARPPMSAHLEPFVEPELCLAKVVQA